MNKSSNMNDSDSMDGGGANEMEEEMNINNTKLVNNNGNDLLERIYDEGQGGKFNDLIKNPTKIKAVKAFITDDELDNMLNLPPDKTKSGFGEVKDGGMSGTMNHVSGNMQDLLSITGFKIIDKLPPTSGEIKDQTYSMIDRFRLSFNDFDSTNGNNTLMNATKSKWTNNGDLEPKLSRPTTTIINLGKKYNANKEESKVKDKKEKETKEENIIQQQEEQNKAANENPLEELNKEIDESYQDEYMNADKDSKDDTFLGRFIIAALGQKSMVTNKIFKSRNLLAGYSIDFDQKGFKGIKDYKMLVDHLRKEWGE